MKNVKSRCFKIITSLRVQEYHTAIPGPIKLKLFTDNPRHIFLISTKFQLDPTHFTEFMTLFLTECQENGLRVGGATVIHFREKRTTPWESAWKTVLYISESAKSVNLCSSRLWFSDTHSRKFEEISYKIIYNSRKRNDIKIKVKYCETSFNCASFEPEFIF